MLRQLWRGLAVSTVVLVDHAAAVPPHEQTARYASVAQDARANASLSEPFLLSRDDEFDDTDLSFIKKMAAIGDSYSAGIGAGGRLGSVFDLLTPGSGKPISVHTLLPTCAGADTSAEDYACSRYDHSYPYIINSDGRLGDKASRNFQFKSCSGAVISDVVDKQIPAIDSNQQVILLSAGECMSGTDLGLRALTYGPRGQRCRAGEHSQPVYL